MPCPSPSPSLVNARIQRTLTPLDPLDLNRDSNTYVLHLMLCDANRVVVSRKLVPRILARASTTASTSKPSTNGQEILPDHLELQKYAQDLFTELNTTVFQKKLSGAEIIWNVRFRETAGDAQVSRSPLLIYSNPDQSSSYVVTFQE